MSIALLNGFIKELFTQLNIIIFSTRFFFINGFETGQEIDAAPAPTLHPNRVLKKFMRQQLKTVLIFSILYKLQSTP
jgi:hypothetical protein